MVNRQKQKATVILFFLIISLLLIGLGNSITALSADKSTAAYLNEVANKAILNKEDAKSHYGGHFVSQNDTLFINWVFDIPRKEVTEKQKDKIISLLGLDSYNVVIVPCDYASTQLDKVMEELDAISMKSKTNAPPYGITAYYVDISINRVIVYIAAPFQDNLNEIVKNINNSETMVFWISGTETGVNMSDISNIADELPIPIFVAGTQINFFWEKNGKDIRYRYDVIDCHSKKTIKSVYTKNNQGFIPSDSNQKGTYKIIVAALNEENAPVDVLQTFIHTEKVVVVPKGEDLSSSFNFKDNKVKGYAVGNEIASTFLPYYNSKGRVIFLPNIIVINNTID